MKIYLSFIPFLNQIVVRKCCGILLLLSLCSSTAVAQTKSDTLSVKLDTIRVHALRINTGSAGTPLSFTRKKRSLAQRNAASPLTLDQITAELPGIWVNDRENYALGERISIRGLGWRASFGVRGLQIVVDGIPLTVADGQSMLTTIDPSFIDEVELVRGPASSFWGNSSGGVLYLLTPRALGETPSLKIKSSVGSYGTNKHDILFSQNTSQHDITVYGSYLYEGGYRDHSSAKLFRSGINGSVELGTQQGLEYMGAFVAMPQAKSPSSLTKQQAAENPTMANPGFVASDAGKQVYQGQAGVTFYTNSPIGDLDVTAHGIYRSLTNPLPFAIINLDRWAGGLRASVHHELGNLSLKGGFDLKFQHDERLEVDNDSARAVQVEQTEKVANQAAFLTLDYQLGSFNILGGLRFDRLHFRAESPNPQADGSRTFQSLNPSIGIAYNSNRFKVYSNLSTSFESPTTTELVNSPNQQSGLNPDLSPERTIGLEAGIKGSVQKAAISYDFAVYNLWIRDILFPFQLQNNGPTYYRNEGKTIHRGFESAITFSFLPNYSLSATYNYTDAFFREAEPSSTSNLSGNSVPGIPEHRLNLKTEYNSGSFLFNVAYTYVGSYTVNNTNTAFNDEYGVFDAGISYIISFPKNGHTLQPFLNVNNIFDTRYNSSVVINAFGDRYFEPAAGINWQIGLSINLF